MWYNPNYINWGPQGWTCPKCGKVWGPHESQCWNCNNQKIIYRGTTTATPEWIYKEDPNKMTAAPNNWWDSYMTTTIADALSNLNINWRDIISNYSMEEE